MNTQTLEKTKDESRSEDQARAQVESILEMVRALDKETAAQDFVKSLSMEQCKAALIGRSTWRPDEDTDDTEGWQEALADVLGDFRGESDCDDNGKTVAEACGFEFDEDDARQTMQDDPLSVQVRSDWTNPGAEMEPAEFMILLCTGGPAVRLVGDLGQYNEPENIRVEHQDWGTPWTEYRDTTSEQDEALVVYCREFLGSLI